MPSCGLRHAASRLDGSDDDVGQGASEETLSDGKRDQFPVGTGGGDDGGGALAAAEG